MAGPTLSIHHETAISRVAGRSKRSRRCRRGSTRVLRFVRSRWLVLRGLSGAAFAMSKLLVSQETSSTGEGFGWRLLLRQAIEDLASRAVVGRWRWWGLSWGCHTVATVLLSRPAVFVLTSRQFFRLRLEPLPLSSLPMSSSMARQASPKGMPNCHGDFPATCKFLSSVTSLSRSSCIVSQFYTLMYLPSRSLLRYQYAFPLHLLNSSRAMW